MKQAARKTPQLSIVPPASAPEGGGQDSADSLKDFFGGWLDSVAPALSREHPPKTPARASGYRHRPITSTDIVRLNRATLRESTDHRHWPADVVAQFLAAEVIRKRQKST
jgi:hypothetical protein